MKRLINWWYKYNCEKEIKRIKQYCAWLHMKSTYHLDPSAGWLMLGAIQVLENKLIEETKEKYYGKESKR